MNPSPFGKINATDFFKGLALCIIVAVLTVLKESVSAQQFQIDWKLVAGNAFTAMLGYLIKNLFSGEVTQ